MNKNTYQTVKLDKGEMHVYDFGVVKLHAYQTNDPIGDEVFLIEKDGKAVVLESPCFHDNIAELTADALAQLPEGKRDVILLSYFLEMTDREISEKLNIVHQTVSKRRLVTRRLVTLKELREYLMKEGFEWPDK